MWQQQGTANLLVRMCWIDAQPSMQLNRLIKFRLGQLNKQLHSVL